MTAKAGFWVVVTAALLWSCGGDGRGSSSAKPTAAPPAAAAPSTAARAVNLCALAPDTEVAKALGAKVSRPAQGSQAMGSSSCDYNLDFGDGHAGLFFVWAGKPAVFFSRELATAEVEAVPGLGQDAWVQHTMPEDSWDLHVLMAPDLAFEAKGDQKARVLKLGSFLATRLR